jgi:hypothetical protein
LPQDQFHTVEAKVVVERWQDGKLLEDTALSWALKTWDDPEVHVYLQHAFAHVPDLAKAGTDGGKLKAVLLQETTWRPSLVVNGRIRGPRTFDESGILTDAPTRGAAAVGAGTRRGFEVFGQATGTGPAKANAVLTSEWLVFTIQAPGSPPQVVRREVFDSLGPAARAAAARGAIPKPSYDEAARLRRALALAGSSDNLLATCRYPMEYILHRRSRKLLESRRDLLRALGEKSNPAGREVIGRAVDPDCLEVMNCGRGVEKGGNETYLDRPNVCRLVTQPEIGANGTIGTVFRSDLAANSVAAATAAGADRFKAALRRGVADTLCEEIAVGQMTRSPEDTSVHTTADVFDRAGKAEGIAVRDPSDAALAALPLSPDVRQRVLDDLAAGQLVVLPKQPADGRIGWWRVDPKSGRTVGVMDNGGCNDDAEYADTLIPEEELEGTMPPRGPRVPMKGDWGRLAEQVIKFRNPQSWDEVFECWQEAYECLYGEWINPG